MGMQDAVPPGYRRALPGCPTCGQDDNVLAVPAIYESSRSTEQTIENAKSTIADEEATLEAKDAARDVLAMMARPTIRSALLAPEPAHQTGCLGCFGFVLLIATVGAWILTANSRDTSHHVSSADLFTSGGATGHNQAAMTAAGILSAIAAVVLVGFVVSLVRANKVKAGRAAADAVWRPGWYCTRCATVHYAPGDEPAGVRPGQPLDPESFRRLVWTAGGYGDRFKPTQR